MEDLTIQLPSIESRPAERDIVIPESRVSRRDAIIRRMTPGEERFEVVDLGSTNGTFVDGDWVERLMLVRGSKVAIGGRILKFEMLDKTGRNRCVVSGLDL